MLNYLEFCGKAVWAVGGEGGRHHRDHQRHHHQGDHDLLGGTCGQERGQANGEGIWV